MTAEAIKLADFSPAFADVLNERNRQIAQEGWAVEHDDQHDQGEMIRAAMNYAAAASLTFTLSAKAYDSTPPLDIFGSSFVWPWARKWWKPGNLRRMLVKAAALLIAEIERLDRAAAKIGGHQ